jgi:hypothetical protein
VISCWRLSCTSRSARMMASSLVSWALMAQPLSKRVPSQPGLSRKGDSYQRRVIVTIRKTAPALSAEISKTNR